jgi:hypothetical protein
VKFTDAIKFFGKTRWRLIAVLCVVQVSIHLPYMHLPAVGHHVWRQCNTLAVARNYAEEDMRIWLPRVDKRYKFPGTTGPSFTAYEYTLACIYKVAGFSHQTHRWLSLVISLLVLAGLFFLVLSFKNDKLLAGLSVAALMSIPQFYYHSINAVPDILAMMFMLWGWVFARRWITSDRLFSFALATIFLALAGMVKLQFLLVGVPIMLELIFQGFWKKPGRIALSAFMGLVVLSASYAWYRHASFLTNQYWLHEFVLDVRLPASLSSFFGLLGINLFSDLPETWLGYAWVPGLLVGIVLAFRNKYLRWYMLATFAGILVIYFLLQPQYLAHGYYTLFFSPFMAITAAYGYYRVFTQGLTIWLFPIAVSGLFWAWSRMHSNWQPAGWRVPTDLVDARNQKKILNTTDTSRRYIVGPDQTGCVYFYYLHAKGYPWYRENDSIEEMARWVEWGANGIITDRPELLQQYADKLEWTEEKQIGTFHWYRVRLKNP